MLTAADFTYVVYLNLSDKSTETLSFPSKHEPMI